jgi:hypothetical protein
LAISTVSDVIARRSRSASSLGATSVPPAPFTRMARGGSPSRVALRAGCMWTINHHIFCQLLAAIGGWLAAATSLNSYPSSQPTGAKLPTDHQLFPSASDAQVWRDRACISGCGPEVGNLHPESSGLSGLTCRGSPTLSTARTSAPMQMMIAQRRPRTMSTRPPMISDMGDEPRRRGSRLGELRPGHALTRPRKRCNRYATERIANETVTWLTRTRGKRQEITTSPAQGVGVLGEMGWRSGQPARPPANRLSW